MLTEKTDDHVKIFDSRISREIKLDDVDEMQTKNQSSMPEQLPKAMAPDEFLAIIEFLSRLKQPE